MVSGGFVEAGGQLVGEAEAVVGVATPAGGVVPFPAVAGGVYVDGEYVEYESYKTDQHKKAFRNMLHNGLSQSERIILRHCFLTDGYMSQQIRGQINNGVPVSCVWIFDGSEVRVLYNTEG